MIKKILTLFIGIIALGVLPAFSQTVRNSHEFTEFNGFVAADEFVVTYIPADYYEVEWTTDSFIEDYVEVYPKDKMIHLEYNKRGFTREVKDRIKSIKKWSPTLQVKIYAPSLSRIEVSGQAIFNSSKDIINTDSFYLSATDQAEVNDLTVDARGAEFNLGRKSVVHADVAADEITVTADGQSLLDLKYECDNSVITAGGASNIKAEGNAGTAKVTTRNSSKVTLTGSSVDMDVDAQGHTLDAINFEVKNAKVYVGSTCKTFVSPSETLSIEMKTGKLTYDGDPALEIVEVTNASISHYDGNVVVKDNN